jgi:hypothetical protein
VCEDCVESEQQVNLETVTDKQLQELERLARELLDVIRRAKLLEQPLSGLLSTLEQEAGKVRRERFDSVDKEYAGY